MCFLAAALLAASSYARPDLLVSTEWLAAHAATRRDRLLAAAGYLVTEPEHTGRHTACSGAGMGMDLLAPEAGEATARRRADELPSLPVLTACAGARRHLAATGRDVGDLLVALADRLDPT